MSLSSEPTGAAPAALALDANLVLAAGAGAGKTHALVSVALGLYVGAGRREPSDPTEVWAVTFTEKAARELRQRIVQRATALAEDPVSALAAEPELAAMLGDREVPAARWRTIVELLPAAPIGTFHSLCGQLLRSYALEAGVDPSFEVLDENDASELFARILDEVLVHELEDHSDSDTRAAARALGGPDTLRAALRRLYTKLGEEGRDPESLLVDREGAAQPGFDRHSTELELDQACAQLAASLELLAGSQEDRLRPSVRALALERNRIGDCEPGEVGRWYPAIVRVASQRRGKGSLPKRARRVWEPFAAAWERVQDAVASLAEQRLGGRIVALLRAVATAYAHEKQRRGVLDFVDLVRGAHDLLRDHRLVRTQVKQRISALLVDEFQDTNGLQLDLVYLLAEARDQARALAPGIRASAALTLGARCFAAVGDRKQSIYEFRGADVSLFQALAARARDQQDGLRLHALRRSWRSRPALVEFCNGLFARLLINDDEGSGFAVDWIDEIDRLDPVRSDHESQRELPAVQLLVAGDPELPSQDLAVRRAAATRALADHVALLLAARPPLGPVGRDGRPRPLRGADVAILMRTHTHVARYRKALDAVGVASIVVGGRGFYAAREVRELAVLLLAIADPSDPLASAGVWRSPVWGIEDGAIVELAAAEHLALADHVQGCVVPGLDRKAADAVTHMAQLVERLHHELDRLGPARVLRFAVDRLGVREVLARDPAGDQRVANVDKLITLLDAPEWIGLGAAARARRLLERSEDLLDREAPAEVAAAADPDAVRIMTIHAAKGLEFPVVLVPELGAEPRGQEGPVLFERELGLAVVSPDPVGRTRPSPHASAVRDRLAARRDAESRRLLYVATTRARNLLVLVGEASEPGKAPGPGRSSANWQTLLDQALPELREWVDVIGPAASDTGDLDSSGSGSAGSAGHEWLLERVAEVRRAATSGPEQTEPAAVAAPSRERPDSATTPARAAAPAIDDPAELAAAVERSEPIALRDCNLELPLAGLAEFDRCPRRYLLTHVVGLDAAPGPATPASELEGPSLITIASASRSASRAVARARGQLVHAALGRLELDALVDDPTRTLARFATGARLDPELWTPIAERLEALAAAPWLAEVVAAERDDPRRVMRSLPFVLELVAERTPATNAGLEPSARDQLALFHPPSSSTAAPAPEGRVSVSGRFDLLWIDDLGRLNLVDWRYARAPAEGGPLDLETLDLDTVEGYARLTQALALRRMWPAEVTIRVGAAFLREPVPTATMHDLDASSFVEIEDRLRSSAARLLMTELGDATDPTAVELWPKLDDPSRCGGCVHLDRCWVQPVDPEQPELELDEQSWPDPELFEGSGPSLAELDAALDREFGPGDLAWGDDELPTEWESWD